LKDLRGNVDTRLRKLGDGEVDALILAAAGLLRLGIVPEHAAPMSVAEMVPAPGQGCLAIQARAQDGPTLDALRALDHRESRLAFEAERRLTALLGGGCALPLGANASVDGERIHLVALVASPDGSEMIRTEADATSPDEVAERAADDLRRDGADAILAKVRP
jgi:hydroxymethylbilane synthase